jgi:uncharacterized membrane protein YgcG
MGFTRRANWSWVAAILIVMGTLSLGPVSAAPASVSALSAGPTGAGHVATPTPTVGSDRSATARAPLSAPPSPDINGTLASVNITPDGAILAPGGVQNFSAVPSCSGGPCPAGIRFLWSLTAPLATLNTSSGANVLLTAGSGNGSTRLTVNASFGSANVSALSVDIQIFWSLGVITGVRISPSFAAVDPGASQTFSAVLTCENNSCPLSIYSRYTWNLTPDLGNLNGAQSSAYFTAGAAGGNATISVVVSANGITKNATGRIETYPLTQQLRSVAIEPYELTLDPHQKVGLQASANCTGGPCPITLLAFNWTLTNPLGNLTYSTGIGTNFVAGAAPGEETVFVNATLNGTRVQSAPVPVTIAASAVPRLLSLSVTPSRTILLAGGVQDLVATPACTPGCPTGIAIVWGAYGSPVPAGTFNTTDGPDVAFTAGAATGQFELSATAYLGNLTAANATAADLTGTSYTYLTSVAVRPALSTTVPGGTVDLTAQPGCSSTTGSPYCTGTIEFKWTLSGGLGTLNATNTSTVAFTAGSATGREQVSVWAWDEGYSATSPAATINISADLTTITSLGIDPATSSVATGGAEILRAEPVCSATCPSSIQYHWTFRGDDGHINPQLDPVTSAFDAGTTVGSDQVEVTATLNGSSRSAEANISVTGSTGTGGGGSPGGLGGGGSAGGAGGIEILVGTLVAIAVVAVGVGRLLIRRRRRGDRGFPPAPTPTEPPSPPS